MESQSIWPPLLVLVLAVGALFAFYHFERVDEANLQLINARTAHTTITRLWEERQNRSGLLQQIQTSKADIEKKKVDLARMRVSVEADMRYIGSSMASAINQVIKDSSAQSIPILELTNGETLKEAKITRAEKGGIGVVHSDGIAKVDIANLPEDILERFDLGPLSLQREIENLQLVVGIAPNVDTKTRETEQQTNARQVIQLEAAIENARNFKNRLEAEVARYDEQIRAAETIGQPTVVLRSSRDVANGKAGDARIELAALEQELIRIRAAAGEFDR